ncbi:hypothetical protein T310_8840, partial [Rasamsonia emersonii CBS 393.64]
SRCSSGRSDTRNGSTARANGKTSGPSGTLGRSCLRQLGISLRSARTRGRDAPRGRGDGRWSAVENGACHLCDPEECRCSRRVFGVGANLLSARAELVPWGRRLIGRPRLSSDEPAKAQGRGRLASCSAGWPDLAGTGSALMQQFCVLLLCQE